MSYEIPPMLDSDEMAVRVSGRATAIETGHPLAEIAGGLAVLRMDDQSVSRPFSRAMRLVTEGGATIRLDCADLRLVQGRTRRSRGAWPRVGEEDVRRLFEDIAPGPGLTCELTLHYIAEGDIVTVTGEPIEYGASFSSDRASTGRELRTLKAHEIRAQPHRPGPAVNNSSSRLPGSIANAGAALLASLAVVLCAAWTGWGNSTAAWAARVGWLTLALCGLWTAARLIWGSVRAYPHAPEHAWLPQLAGDLSGRHEASPPIDGFAGSILAIVGNFFFLRDAWSALKGDTYDISPHLLWWATTVSLTAAGLAAFPLWKRERRDARLARALLGNLVGDKAWKTIEGRLEAKSPAPSTREVNVTWSVRRGSRRTRVKIAAMEATTHVGAFALLSSGKRFELDTDRLWWGGTDIQVERTPEGMSIRWSASEGMHALVSGYLDGNTFRARGPGSLVVFATPPGVPPRTRLTQLLCMHYVGPSIVILGMAAVIAAAALAALE